MKHKYPHLFSPITLGNVTFRNRMFASPTSQPSSQQPLYLRKEWQAFYELRAKGGAASVCMGDSIVHSITGKTHSHKVIMDDPTIFPMLADVARSVRQHGAIPSLELQHGGRFANVPNVINGEAAGRPTYGPSHEINPDGYEILEMPEALILEIVEAYGKAAATAKMCGFGMITVHGGHGWMLQQFFSPSVNRRTDRFGGSRENRVRFALLALDAIRNAVGPGFPIEFRMSGAEFTKGGYDIDEGVEIAKLLAPKVDLLHVSAGVHDDPDTFVITHPTMFYEHGCNVWLAERIKKAVDVPVATIGGLCDPAMMEEILASGKADVVEMSRALIADPYLPRKALLGQEDEIVKCIRCLTCMDTIRTHKNLRCALNPVIGREWEHMFQMPGTQPRRVLVAGGGPAGLQAAVAAAGRGHTVTLCEASDRLGGWLKCEEHVPFKQEAYDFILKLEQQARKAGVEIRLGTKVTPELAESLAPDAIISALGSEHIVPKIPGIDRENVLFLPDLCKEDLPCGERVAILGGGLVGCETAVHLTRLGKKVTVIEQLPNYANDAPFFHKQALAIQLRQGIELALSTKAVEITAEGVLCETAEGEKRMIEADTVFCAVGVRPRRAETEELRACAPLFYAVGDSSGMTQLYNATTSGYYAALDI